MTQKPLDDLNKEAIDVLVERFGLADTIRFLRQFTGDLGDYTRERQALPDERLEDVLNAIWAQRQTVPRPTSGEIGPMKPSAYEARLRAIREKHQRAYAPWTTDEEEELVEKYAAGESVKTLATHFGRQPSAIRSRLQKLGLIG